MSELCGVCQSEAFKYKCPSCGTRSCSLACVQKHKLQMQCTGKVDPTRYLKKDDISLVEVNRDYNFLLNVDRRINVGKEDAKQMKLLSLNLLKRPFHGGFNRATKRVFTNSFDDQNVSIKRGVKVKFVPKGMSRSNINKTGFDKKKNCFNWTVEWLLIDDDLNKVLHRFTSYKCNENSKLGDCFPNKNFIKYLETAETQIAAPEAENEIVPLEVKSESDTSVLVTDTTSEIVENTQIETTEDNTEDKTETAEGSTKEEPLYKFNFFIRNYSQLASDKIYRLDPTQTIANLLKDKTVLEFPTIYVSLKKEIKNMKVLDNDEKEEEKSSSDSSDTASSEESSSDDSDDESEDDAPEESSTKQKTDTEPPIDSTVPELEIKQLHNV